MLNFGLNADYNYLVSALSRGKHVVILYVVGMDEDIKTLD